jgi:hypothetical protein
MRYLLVRLLFLVPFLFPFPTEAQVVLPEECPVLTGEASEETILESVGDVRWWRVVVREDGVLRYRGTGKETRLTPTLFDRHGQEIPAVAPDWLQTDRIWAARVRPGTVYLRLTANRTDGETFRYQLLLEGLDADEPDDVRPQELGREFKRRSLPRGDIDAVSVEVDRRCLLIVRQFNALASDRQMQFRILDADGDVVADTIAGFPRFWDDGDLWVAVRAEPGTYTVQTWSVDTGWGYSRLQIELMEEMDPYEPNDSAALSRSIPLGRWISLLNLPDGDEDWFRVTVPATGILTVVQRKPDRTRVRIEAELERDGETLPLSDRIPCEDGLVQSIVVEPGAYDLKVATVQPDILPVEVRGDWEPFQEVAEPNQTLAEAGELPLHLRLRSWPPGDVDWYSLTLDESKQVTLRSPKRIALRLLRDGELVRIPSVLDGDDGWVGRVNLGPGAHGLRFEAVDPSPDRISLVTDLENQVDAFEPNDRRSEAAWCPSSFTAPITLFPGDRDWLELDLSSRSLVEFRLLGVEEDSRIQIAIPDLDVSQRFPIEEAAVITLEADAGPLAVCLSDEKGTGRAVTLQVRVIPDENTTDDSLTVFAVETPDGERESLKLTTYCEGGRWMPIANRAQLGPTLLATLEPPPVATPNAEASSEETRTPQQTPFWPWVVGGGIVLILIWWKR